VKGTTKAFLFGLIVGAVAYHIMMNSKAPTPVKGKTASG